MSAVSSSACEAAHHKEQNQNFILHNKFKTYDRYKLRQVAAIIAENVGFSTASTSSLSVLSSLFKVYLENLCRDTAEFAFHDDRDGNKIALEDVSRIFEKFSINLGELHDYFSQVENFALNEEVPLFPISTLTQPDLSVQQKQYEIVNENIEVVNDLAARKEEGEDEGEEDIWICPVCSVAYVDSGSSMVGCDGCDKWFHWGCVGIFIPPPENASWFCTECKKKKQKKQQQ